MRLKQTMTETFSTLPSRPSLLDSPLKLRRLDESWFRQVPTVMAADLSLHNNKVVGENRPAWCL